MNKIVKLCGLLGAMLLSVSVYAGDIQVESAWARATAPGQDTAMVDLSITSVKEAKLVGFSSAACKTAEIHSMTHDNGMMKMREVKAINLPAGRRVVLGESGYHLMLIGLKSPLKAGESVPLTLNIKVGNEMVKVEAKAEVRQLTEAKPMDEHMHHMHHMDH
ncbi:MAG: copper chaperone PCu(A)C [Proteobacteria bacterium]|nr:copper chaperone PCu(A)C [Pseudomonadota bacterium]